MKNEPDQGKKIEEMFENREAMSLFVRLGDVADGTIESAAKASGVGYRCARKMVALWKEEGLLMRVGTSRGLRYKYTGEGVVCLDALMNFYKDMERAVAL